DIEGKPREEHDIIIQSLIDEMASDVLLNSTFSHVSLVKSLAMSLIQHGNTLPSVTYDSVSKDIISVEGVPVSLAIFQKVVTTLAEDCHKEMVDILQDYYPYQHLPSNLCQKIMDSTNETRPDFSFLSSPDNSHLSALCQAAGDRFMKWADLKPPTDSNSESGPGSDPTTDPGSDPEADYAQKLHFMQRWLSRTGSLCIKLMTLCQFTGGLPARGTELEGLTCKNINSAQRSLLWHCNTIALVFYYNKSSASKAMPKVTLRYLPRFVSEMLVVFLTCIRSCEKLVAWCLHDLAPALFPKKCIQAYYDLLFVKAGKPINTSQISSSIEGSFTKIQANARLNTQKYRQFASALAESKTSFGRVFQGFTRANQEW
ncbi:hypothetical protein IW150_007331, partial [Coemansia sp. RSA 2607]